MQVKRLSELRALIAHPDFQDWWAALVRARQDSEAAQVRYDELLSQTTLMEFRAEATQKNAIDTLYRAGESEDAAASMVAEATELENRSFRAVSDFEEQRYKVSEIWYRLGAAERSRDDKRAANAEAKSKKSEADLKAAERLLRSIEEDYQRETQHKERLWLEVERLWDNSLEVSLSVAEQRLSGKKIRRRAEALFAQAEERKAKAKELRAEAEAASAACDAARAQIKKLLEQAKERFGCAAGTDFLYFRQKENQKLAFCVPLIEDSDSYNVEVKPLSIYSVDRQRGVAFLEPARAEHASNEEGDRRFEEYFLRGRKGDIAVRRASFEYAR